MITYRDHYSGILQWSRKVGLNLNTAQEQERGQWMKNYQEGNIRARGDSC